MPKIGIIGGTFDPIHNGHVEMARCAADRLGISKILFITGGNPPHKKDINITDAKLRSEMVKRTIKCDKRFEAFDYEIEKEGYSYTADTLEYLTGNNPKNDYYFILGADSLDYIDNWYKPEKIFELAKILVFSRGGFDCRKKTDALVKKFGGQIIILDDDIPDISSTLVRTYADMGQDISRFVSEEAEKLIWEKRLYRSEFSELRAKVMRRLEEKRFAHTLGVCKAAVKLAEIFGEDVKKAYTAALLHDIAKNIPKDEMYEMCEKNAVALDEFEKEHPVLVHAKLGAYIAKSEFGICDEDIINAIKWHTLGRCEMSRLEKIIFVADMIEEGRHFPEVDKIRKEAFKNLDRALYMALDSTICFNEEKGSDVHKEAYVLRDYFKKLCCI